MARLAARSIPSTTLEDQRLWRLSFTGLDALAGVAFFDFEPDFALIRGLRKEREHNAEVRLRQAPHAGSTFAGNLQILFSPSMALVILLLLGALACGAVSLRRYCLRHAGDAQLSWWIRMGLAAAFGLELLGVVILPLPFKFRILALVPAFFLISIFTTVFRSGRERMRRNAGPDIERMKRLN